jgi:hypothetical protein
MEGLSGVLSTEYNTSWALRWFRWEAASVDDWVSHASRQDDSWYVADVAAFVMERIKLYWKLYIYILVAVKNFILSSVC